MSEQQQTKKKNKKKKGNSQTQAPIASEDINKNDTLKLEATLNTVCSAIKFKDVDITMTNSGNGAAGNGTSKKKKKKKNKQSVNIESAESLPSETDNLLSFNENHIELINHPEISVTISNETLQITEPPKCPKDINPSNNSKEPSEIVESATCSKKKKKKKKKKKNSESNSNNPPSTEEVTEDIPSTPTYVKLPADGDNCVLLVSHESFSNGNRQTKNVSTSDDQKKTSVLLTKTEIKETTNNPTSATATLPIIQNENSVSIFPVYSNSDANTPKSSKISATSSLDKINNTIEKKDIDVSTNCNAPGTPVDGEEIKTKAQLKAERRAKQEAQRAAKLAKSIENSSAQVKDIEASSTHEKNLVNVKQQISKKQNQPLNENSATKKVTKSSVERDVRKVQIFSHLPQYQDLLSKHLTDSVSKIPPPILELGAHYSKGTLCGSNARCVGFLSAVREIILDYVTPPDKPLAKDLENKLQIYLEYLSNCRPLSVSIVNAMKFLKHQINHIPEDFSDERAKEVLSQSINDFVREEILLAKEAITISASAKIVNDDTILVFAYSSLVKEVLCKAYNQKKTFKVIIVDSRAKLEGLEMLRQLVKHGLHCSYISINAVSSVIKKVNKVFIGAHALLANGFVMSRLGCKILSLVGSTYSVPVLVCCETYKFWERALTDSIVHNELGNPDDLVLSTLDRKDSLLKWHDLSSLQIYNLLYDVTPSDFVSVVITEKGLVPCTSVPVLLRVKHAGRGPQE